MINRYVQLSAIFFRNYHPLSTIVNLNLWPHGKTRSQELLRDGSNRFDTNAPVVCSLDADEPKILQSPTKPRLVAEFRGGKLIQL